MMDPRYEKKFWWMCGLTILLLIHSESRASDWEWDRMCRIIEKRHGYSCEGVTPPTIIEVEQRGPDFRFEAGGYRGGDTITVSEELTGRERPETIIHEQVHYLLTVLDVYVIPGPPREVCPSEAIAWDVSNKYARSKGLKINRRWWTLYSFCENPEKK